jgi:hypothetical protein
MIELDNQIKVILTDRYDLLDGPFFHFLSDEYNFISISNIPNLPSSTWIRTIKWAVTLDQDFEDDMDQNLNDSYFNSFKSIIEKNIYNLDGVVVKLHTVPPNIDDIISYLKELSKITFIIVSEKNFRKMNNIDRESSSRRHHDYDVYGAQLDYNGGINKEITLTSVENRTSFSMYDFKTYYKREKKITDLLRENHSGTSI